MHACILSPACQLICLVNNFVKNHVEMEKFLLQIYSQIDILLIKASSLTDGSIELLPTN